MAKARSTNRNASAPGAGVGRPSKLTSELRQRFMQMVQTGAGIRDCAAAAGINPDTVYEWRRRGNADKQTGKRSEYRLFSEQLAQAQATGVVAALAKIDKAANGGDWRAAAWKLERLRPRRFGRQRVEVAGPDGTPVTAQVFGKMLLPRMVEDADEWAREVAAEIAESERLNRNGAGE